VALACANPQGGHDHQTTRHGRRQVKHANIEFEPYRGLAPEVVDALQRGKKIEAIKSYCSATGLGLKEAKESIEDIQRRAGD
jgi:ribosomal protein L7/L12